MSWILPEHPWDKQVQTPQRWLELATAGLAEAAAEQVQAEYRARLTGALAAGQTEAEVLREWGDPNDAARALRRVHLTQGEAATPVLRPGGGWAGLWVSVRQDALGLALLAVLALHPEAGNFWLVLALTAPILTALRWRLLAVPLTHTQAAWCDGLLRPFTLWALAALLSSVAAFAALPPALVPTTFAGESGQPDWGRMLVVGLPLYLEWSRRRQLLAAARKRDATGTPRLGD